MLKAAAHSHNTALWSLLAAPPALTPFQAAGFQIKHVSLPDPLEVFPVCVITDTEKQEEALQLSPSLHQQLG